MTKETKIGLLVGLAFIILFAVILSEKGAAPRGSVPAFTELDPGRGAKDISSLPLADSGKLPIETLLPEPVRNKPAARPAKSTPAVETAQRPAETPPALPELPDSLLTRLDNSAKIAAMGPKPEEPKPTVLSSVPPRDAKPAEAKPADAPRTVASAIETALGPPASTGEAAERAESADPAKRGRSYVVQKGDTLTSIARKHFGTSSQSIVRAMLKANAKGLKSERSLRAGQTIVIPEIAELASDYRFEPEQPQRPAPASGGTELAAAPGDTSTSASLAARPAPAAETPVKPAAAEKRATRLYEVRSKDTLIRIARSELGDGRRYKEILELNRDRIGPRGTLKPGMKLRLPERQKADGEAGSRSSLRRTESTVAAS